ncbi:MAG: NAD(P)H-dependent oxidoreductase [Paludibacterium sp.]|uniref:NADPH-dependent FMN reductase n=1 Tax=Paludibacterium sp. TaxID=1917523 RepID=UPI00260082C3|nr:NADPH-dependent FMN reductase [Paludibacterium sp.]MBV8048033.1 NAD(P)H-dependent oxidoreductase [Paludibacterium sp.]
MNVLALCGSLRAASTNAALLRAIQSLAAPRIVVELFDEIGTLPLFNPDLEGSLPSPVQTFHRRVAAADALMIASPEYAHGVTGTIKNALDWLVGFELFVNKPVVVLNASPRARHADAALRETLQTMSAHILETASVTVPLLGSGLDEKGIVASANLARTLTDMLDEIHRAVGALQRDK